MTETFDPNFCFPVKDLENDWIKLTPFNVRPIDQRQCVTLLIDEIDRPIIFAHLTELWIKTMGLYILYRIRYRTCSR